MRKGIDAAGMQRHARYRDRACIEPRLEDVYVEHVA